MFIELSLSAHSAPDDNRSFQFAIFYGFLVFFLSLFLVYLLHIAKPKDGKILTHQMWQLQPQQQLKQFSLQQAQLDLPKNKNLIWSITQMTNDIAATFDRHGKLLLPQEWMNMHFSRICWDKFMCSKNLLFHTSICISCRWNASRSLSANCLLPSSLLSSRSGSISSIIIMIIAYCFLGVVIFAAIIIIVVTAHIVVVLQGSAVNKIKSKFFSSCWSFLIYVIVVSKITYLHTINKF